MEIRLGIKTQITKRIFSALLACFMISSPALASHGEIAYQDTARSVVGKYIGPSIKALSTLISVKLLYEFLSYSKYKKNQLTYSHNNEDKKAGPVTQKKAQIFFRNLLKSKIPGPLGKFLTYFREKTCRPPIVYQKTERCAFPSFLSHKKGICMDKKLINKIENPSNGNNAKPLAILHHEIVHYWQFYSSFIRYCYVDFGSTTKCRHYKEYQAEQKTIEQLYKMKMYNEAKKHICNSILKPHPYFYGAFDAYKKFATLHSKNNKSVYIENIKQCALNKLNGLKKTKLSKTRRLFLDKRRKEIIELLDEKRLKGWRARYREYRKSLSWKQWFFSYWKEPLFITKHISSKGA